MLESLDIINVGPSHGVALEFSPRIRSTGALVEVEAADKLLRKAGLPDIDLFWVHWDYFVEQARQPAAPKGEPCPVSDRSHAGGTC